MDTSHHPAILEIIKRFTPGRVAERPPIATFSGMQALLTGLKVWARRHIKAIAIWLVMAVVGLVFDNWLTGTAVPFVTAWASRPIGTVALLLVAWLAVLLLLAVLGSIPLPTALKEAWTRREVGSDTNAQAEERAKEMEAEVQGLQRKLRQHHERWHYGEELREFSPLTEVQREEVVSRVAELLPTINKLMHWCDKVWTYARPEDDDVDSAIGMLAVLVEKRAHEPLFRVAQVLNESVDARQDPRALLVCFYARYREWRDWVHRVAGLYGVDVSLADGYSEWWRYDDKFREELVQKVAAPNLAYVKKALTDYNGEHGWFQPMAPPSTPSA